MNSVSKAIVLGFFFSLCASAAVVTHVLRAHTPAPAPHELYAVVNRQIAAFRSDDFPSAYQYAATGVQHQFTVAQFAAMIRREYPELARARGVEFGEVDVRGASASVQVYFLGPDGLQRSVLYNLVNESGRWKIAGAEQASGAALRPFNGTHA